MNPQRERNVSHLDTLQMIDNPEQHCLAYLQGKLRNLNRPRIGGLDPEEVRRLTHNCRRDTWQPPQADGILSAEGERRHRLRIIRAYLTQWGDMRANELEKHGVSVQFVGRAALSIPGVERVIRYSQNEHGGLAPISFYVMNKGSERA